MFRYVSVRDLSQMSSLNTNLPWVRWFLDHYPNDDILANFLIAVKELMDKNLVEITYYSNGEPRIMLMPTSFGESLKAELKKELNL